MPLYQIVARILIGFAQTSLTLALPTELSERQIPDGDCTHGPFTRACWKDGYSIATDFDEKFPTNGRTATYNLEFTNGTCNPDGNGDRLCLLINGQYPGPTITAEWGDHLEINVKNSMQDNGTSVHWHGVRQYGSVADDGVNGITECPLAPGDLKTYRFQVTQYGTSWYHSHFSSQYGDGVIGAMVFNGPSSANYDEDLGPYILNDWYYSTVYQVNAFTSVNLQGQRPPPPSDNILINATNKNANGRGAYNLVKIQKGKKYRLRLINMSVDNYIRVSLDNHRMQIIASDFIPIQPYTVETLLLGVGQRYDVVIHANQPSDTYWFRANAAADCLSLNALPGRAIWTYDDAPTSNTCSSTTTPLTLPHDEPSACLEPTPTPYWRQPVPRSAFEETLSTLGVSVTRQALVPNGSDTVFVWALNGSAMSVDWADPTLSRVSRGATQDFPASLNVLPTVRAGGWNYWLIQQLADAPPLPHPIHLHGHDFFVLGQGPGHFEGVAAVLDFDTAPRRDTANVPGNGWLALAFRSDNAGAWLMHCHIAWHVSQGLAVQFLESPDQIDMPDRSEYQQTCDNWETYQATAYWRKDDSGL